MPQVLHCVAGSSPAPETGSSVGRANVPVPLSLPAGPGLQVLSIDPANAGGTTEQRGNGFDSRAPHGASSTVERAAMFHLTLVAVDAGFGLQWFA